MLYLFTGNNRFLIQEEAQRWKHNFADKFGIENVLHITNLENTTQSFLTESLLGRSLFSEKRLVIIDGFPYSGENAFSGAADIEKLILDSLKNIPEETLVVFLAVSPDKRKVSYKTLSKLAEVKEFSTAGEDQVIHILQKKYGDTIDYVALQKLVHYKGGDLQKSISEIEKLSLHKLPLSILSGVERGNRIGSPFPLGGERIQDRGIVGKAANKISLQDIEQNIIPEFEESIFVFIDTLLAKNKKQIFSEFENLLNFSNFYAVYQSIIANLRVFVYIEFLKSQKKSPKEIGDILKLGNRQFLINKKHNSSFQSLQKLYTHLLNFDKNMKFGKLISSDEKDLKREIESIFLKFIK
ncbi:hypothetical protein N9J72_00320 [Candidatus Gracilibacteria bacterium]|nr:hypothetical protein [Candidatus Gracilibacteria bacterium]